MPNLKTKYLGLNLKNPLIVSSSGLTNSVDKIKKLQDAGAGAVVLKSLFEEQINHETSDILRYNDYPEAIDYIRNYAKSNSIEEYLELIEKCKKSTDIPIIPSINCISITDWTSFAKSAENAGADALELNVYIIPTNKFEKAEYYENKYLEIVRKVKSIVKIPVSIKLGYHFTNLLNMAEQIASLGVNGVVLFNRFYEPDIDIENMRIVAADVFSSVADIRHSLRWVGMLSNRISKLDISASTGIHDGKGVVKQLLAGAAAVQLCSTLYKNGFEQIGVILSELEKWMEFKGFTNINDFKGKLNYQEIKNPAIYERAQFMKYFSNIE